jgi:2-amino-4-hydroxy-6-hydroxymethyldihydropteridine diphosphokinase
MPEVAYIALGSNIGDRAGFLAFARASLAALPATRLVAASTVDETAPIGGVEQPSFLNQMVCVETSLGPHELLAHTQRIEAAAGRDRTGPRWGPRTLDLDIVRFGDVELSDAALTVPHPELAHRDFWLRGLLELGALGASGATR